MNVIGRVIAGLLDLWVFAAVVVAICFAGALVAPIALVTHGAQALRRQWVVKFQR